MLYLISALEWKEPGGRAAFRSCGCKPCLLYLSALHMVLLGFHTVLWLQGGSSTAKMNVTVNAAFETLVDHHEWGEEAQESLYVMCNNSQDVASLQHHTEAWNNPNKIRVETVASSASTTAKVAAVIQRGGSFLSGSFTDPIWAEDCAGRATVCLTRSISYTVLISPLEMMGMFGMAQVIGAKSLGINVLIRTRTPSGLRLS